MKLVQINELKEGMVLEKDVINELGITILGKGTLLSESHISSLERLDTAFVYVKDIKGDTSSDMLFMDDLNGQYEQFIRCFKDLYMDVRLGKQVDLNAIARPLRDMVVTLVRSNDVLTSMRDIKVSDIYTYRHCINVAMLSSMLAKWSGLGRDEVMEVAIAAVLHDLGKSLVSPNVINKPGRLSGSEMAEARKHVEYSMKVVNEMDGIPDQIRDAVLHHHERNDGSGYPSGLKADQISRYAKIIAIADTFDALTNDKVYQKKVTPYKAIEIIRNESFGKLDEELVGIFVKKISQFYVGNLVRLSNGATAEVVMINRQDLSRPLVKMENQAYLDLATNYRVDIVEVLGKTLIG